MDEVELNCFIGYSFFKYVCFLNTLALLNKLLFGSWFKLFINHFESQLLAGAD